MQVNELIIYKCDRGFIFLIYKEFLQINKKGTQEKNGEFIKGDMDS